MPRPPRLSGDQVSARSKYEAAAKVAQSATELINAATYARCLATRFPTAHIAADLLCRIATTQQDEALKAMMRAAAEMTEENNPSTE